MKKILLVSFFVFFGLTANVIAQCVPTSNNTSDYIEDFFTSVGFGSDISNLNSGFTAPGYQDNTTTQSVEQLAGDIVNFTVDFSGTFYTYGFNIWVDWNNDNVFNNTNEKVYATGGYVTGVNDDFTIPVGTPSGSYRMRIRADYLDTDPSPCGAITYGEAEDYTLTIPSVTCTNDPSGISTSSITTNSVTISWTAAGGSASSYQYYVSTNPNPPSYGYDGTPTNLTSEDLSGLSESTIHYVWIRSVCSGSNGLWIGPVSFTTLTTPPTTTSVTICPGDPSQDLTANAPCSTSTNVGTQLDGYLDASVDNVTFTPDLPILGGGSQNFCAFETSYTSNYHAINFTVDVTGTYTFNLQTPVPYFDALAYIVINDGNFTPGSCATGTWLLGDDDSGPDLNPTLTVNLTAFTEYTIITTKYTTSSTTHTGPYTWDMIGPGSLIINNTGNIEWYTTASGGSPIGTGTNFDPIGIAGSGITDTNNLGVYNYWAACSSSPDTRTQANFIIGKVWNGSPGNTDWNTATNWIPNGVPNATDCVVIVDTSGNDPIIDGTTNGLGYSLTIEADATLTQQSNSTLTIVNTIDVETGGTYDMEDSSSLIQVDNVTNNVDGTFTMDRNSADIRLYDYVYWSSPVTTFDIENISPLTPANYLYYWNPSYDRGASPPPNSVPNDYGRWETASGSMNVGTGYIVRGPAGYSASTPNPFTATFYGSPNNGNILNVPISRGIFDGLPYNGPGDTQVTEDDDNWNLLGNPYPSAISGRQFVIDNTNIDGTLYLWTHATQLANNPTNDPFYDNFVYNYDDDYISVNLSGPLNPGDPGDLMIGAGQGFFVFMNDDPIITNNVNSSVFFNNAMRNATYANNVFYRNSSNSTSEEEIERHRIWLDIVSPNNIASTILVGYIQGATNEDDRLYDGYAFSESETLMYSIVGDKKMAIQGKSLPFNEQDTVPLGVVFNAQGSYSIAINTIDGLFETTDQNIYLEDTYLGIVHDLRSNPYSFSSETGTFNDRFILKYTNSTLSIEDFDSLNGVKVYRDNDEIVVTSSQEIIESIEVYDILGRNLFVNKSINLNRFGINSIEPNELTLFLKIKLADGKQKIAKIIF